MCFCGVGLGSAHWSVVMATRQPDMVGCFIVGVSMVCVMLCTGVLLGPQCEVVVLCVCVVRVVVRVVLGGSIVE